MDFYQPETNSEITNSKTFTISFGRKIFLLISLKIELYSDNSIEFNVYFINLKEPDFFHGKYEQKELLKSFKINPENKKYIFDFCCELAENKKVRAEKNKNQNQPLNLIFTKEKKDEIIFKLKKDVISGTEVKKILFNELIKKSDKSDAVPMKTELNFNSSQLNKIQEQMQKILYQIIINDNNNNSENKEIEIGIGFIIKINYNQNDFILLLITNTQVLNEKDIKNETRIILNNINKNIRKNIKLSKYTKNYINEDLEIAIIEIPQSLDNFFEFIELDEKILKNILPKKEEENISKIFNSLDNIYNNQSIYSIYYPKGKDEIKVVFGSIEKIYKNNIIHKCFINEISMGSPILLSKTGKVIGIHKSKNDQGISLLFPLYEFFFKYKKNFQEEENLVNEIIIDEYISVGESEISRNNSDNIEIQNNEMIIEYYINNKSEINIFNLQFVINNKEKCQIIHNNETYELVSGIFKTNPREEVLRIKLKEKEKITDMSFMFNECYSLKSVNISNWNTENVLNMSHMFSGCNNLKDLVSISKLKTNNVINMSNMFNGCKKLFPFPDISSWNTKKLKDISFMFSECKTSPNIGNWNLSSVENMSYLFCKNEMNDISFISSWTTIESVTDMSFLFSECFNLKKIPDLSNWNVSNVTNMNSLFEGCKELLKIEGIQNWDVSNVKTMDSFFKGCKKLNDLPDISLWNMSSVTDIKNFFRECKILKSLPDISKWNFNNIKEINGIFRDCINLISIPDISKWDISKVDNLSGIFCGCKNIKSLPDISNWKTNNVQNMSELFCNCINLENLPDITKWDFSNVENINKICFNCEKLINLPEGIEKIKFKKVKYKNQVFDNCNNLTKIPNNIVRARKDIKNCIIY